MCFFFAPYCMIPSSMARAAWCLGFSSIFRTEYSCKHIRMMLFSLQGRHRHQGPNGQVVRPEVRPPYFGGPRLLPDIHAGKSGSNCFAVVKVLPLFLCVILGPCGRLLVALSCMRPYVPFISVGSAGIFLSLRPVSLGCQEANESSSVSQLRQDLSENVQQIVFCLSARPQATGERPKQKYRGAGVRSGQR